MKLPIERSCACVVLALGCAWMANSNGAESSAADVSSFEHKLWLPLSQRAYMPNLIRAANTVAGWEKCKSLVRGELLESKSTTDRPVFRIICRDDKQKTYPTLIDGISLEELHITGETLEQQNRRHVPQYSRLCISALKKEASAMINSHWPEGVTLEPVYLDERLIEFEVDFTAETLAGEKLLYRGYCEFNNLQRYKVYLKPRPAAEK